MKSGAPRYGFGVVDVRDLAVAHLAAAYIPQAKGRHIISGHESNLFEMAQTLIPKYRRQIPAAAKGDAQVVGLVGCSNGQQSR